MLRKLLASFQATGPIGRDELYTFLEPLQAPREQRRHGYSFFTDFMTTSALVATATGTGAAAGSTSAAGGSSRPGVIVLTAGTTTTGYASLASFVDAVRFGDGVWEFSGDFYIPVASDGTETFEARFGFFDAFTGAVVDGAYFYHNSADASWGCKTVANSVSTLTDTDTNIAATAATWHNLRVVVDTTTSVKYYINGVLAATHTANIPNGASRDTGFGFGIVKTAGTTARTVQADWLACSFIATSMIRE